MAHDLDAALLARWQGANVPGFVGSVRLAEFPGGQSNPTYRMEASGGACVLRRKPLGPILPSAHAPDQPEVAAVIDWELATPGDPLAAFTYLAMNRAMPADGRSGLAGIVQGVKKRMIDGNASSAQAQATAGKLMPLAEAA